MSSKHASVSDESSSRPAWFDAEAADRARVVPAALRLFASVFHRETDARLLEEIKARGQELSAALGGDPLAEQDLINPDAVVEALAVEYCRLFVGPRGHMPPVGSIVLGEGRFWGPSTEAVAEFYRSAGLELLRGPGILPDHVSNELDCLAVLEEQERPGEAAAFAREHVLYWLPSLARHIEGRATVAFYRVWVMGLHRLLIDLYHG